MIETVLSPFQKSDKSSLIPILQEIQGVYGYLPEQALEEASDYVGLALCQVYGVATFYNQFRLTPLGENVIAVCRGTACHVKNSANILFAFEDELKIKAGETTRDKKFTIEVVSCIGACSIAPVVKVNDDYHGRLAVKDVSRVVKQYSKPVKKVEPAKPILDPAKLEPASGSNEMGEEQIQ